MLKNINELKSSVEKKYSEYDPTIEISLPIEFQNSYREILQDSGLTIEYSEYTATIVTTEKLTIICPNQWFFIAAYFSPYVKTLLSYKEHFYKIFSTLSNTQIKDKISKLRDEKSISLDDMEKIKQYFDIKEDVEKFTLFLCNYDWWAGSKTIDRGDFYVSPVLKMAKVVHISQGYIAAIADIFAENPKLQILLEDLVNAPKKVKNSSSYILNKTSKGSLVYEYQNILFKGVPGTGKSRTIDNIIKDKLNLDLTSDKENILRINIHSASSNADLMQGIGITTTEKDQVAYKEKQGLIYEHIRKACYSPNQPFVLVLEEIQENSLNELIGDLIYLIEPSKRLQIDKLQNGLSDKDKIPYLGDDGLITRYINNVQEYNEGKGDDEKLSIHSVKIPFLVETSTEYRELILPSNLYIFCTSNYRDDKKVIEDNLLRRFEVYELYPTYDEKVYKSKYIAAYLKSLNISILDAFKDEEIHPDRFQIGHANWYSIEENGDTLFYKALLKVVVEFKEIKEVEFDKLRSILTSITLDEKDNWVHPLHQEILTNIQDEKKSNYKLLIDFLQNRAYSDLF